MNEMEKASGKTRIQSRLAIASFASGTIIACICLFFIEPIGEISNSAIGIVSEMLMLCGALLGIKTSMDLKLQRFEGEVNQRTEELRKELTKE